jgi:hypothetical protein
VTSGDIIKLLKTKHSEDIFVPECKDGPSGSSFAMIDAWAMPRSWSHPAVTAYEIKISRSDFVRDNKWQKYLACCNLFYFVAPTGIIDPNELPAEVGLMEVSKTGGRLWLRKKAALRQVTIPESLFRYVLMNRCTITGERPESYKPSTWEDNLAKKAEDRRYGHMLGKRIGKMFREDVVKVEAENVELKEKMARYDDHIAFLKSIGFDPANSWMGTHQLGDKVNALRLGISESLLPDVNRMIVQLEHFKGDLKAAIEDNKKPAPSGAG